MVFDRHPWTVTIVDFSVLGKTPWGLKKKKDYVRQCTAIFSLEGRFNYITPDSSNPSNLAWPEVLSTTMLWLATIFSRKSTSHNFQCSGFVQFNSILIVRVEYFAGNEGRTDYVPPTNNTCKGRVALSYMLFRPSWSAVILDLPWNSEIATWNYYTCLFVESQADRTARWQAEKLIPVFLNPWTYNWIVVPTYTELW